MPVIPANVPSPDPSALTTAQLRHEMAALKEWVEKDFAARDRATDVLSEHVNRVPTLLDRQVAQMKELFGEKFESIQKQFDERDIRARASEAAAVTAVNAALQAQKEAASAQNDANAAAITKSEAATVKQIDGILALLASNTKAIDEKIASINGRLDRGEGAIHGSGATIAAIVATVVAVVTVVGVILTLVLRH